MFRFDGNSKAELKQYLIENQAFATLCADQWSGYLYDKLHLERCSEEVRESIIDAMLVLHIFDSLDVNWIGYVLPIFDAFVDLQEKSLSFARGLVVVVFGSVNIQAADLTRESKARAKEILENICRFGFYDESSTSVFSPDSDQQLLYNHVITVLINATKRERIIPLAETLYSAITQTAALDYSILREENLGLLLQASTDPDASPLNLAHALVLLHREGGESYSVDPVRRVLFCAGENALCAARAFLVVGRVFDFSILAGDQSFSMYCEGVLNARSDAEYWAGAFVAAQLLKLNGGKDIIEERLNQWGMALGYPPACLYREELDLQHSVAKKIVSFDSSVHHMFSKPCDFNFFISHIMLTLKSAWEKDRGKEAAQSVGFFLSGLKCLLAKMAKTAKSKGKVSLDIIQMIVGQPMSAGPSPVLVRLLEAGEQAEKEAKAIYEDIGPKKGGRTVAAFGEGAGCLSGNSAALFGGRRQPLLHLAVDSGSFAVNVTVNLVRK